MFFYSHRQRQKEKIVTKPIDFPFVYWYNVHIIEMNRNCFGQLRAIAVKNEGDKDMEEQERVEQEDQTWIPEEELCGKCKSRPVDRSENRNSILCRECREEQIRYPFPKKMLPAVILVLGLMALAMARTPKVLRCYKSYTDAMTQAAVGDIYPALVELQEVLDEYPDSVPVAERMVDLSMKHGYFDVAAYALNAYMAGKSVSESTYTKLDNYSSRLKRYYNTIDSVSKLFEDLDDTMDLEEQQWQLENLKKKLLAMTDASGYDNALLYYYLGSISEDQDEALRYLQTSAETDLRLAAVTQVPLGTNLRRRGDLKGAREAYEKALALDRNNSGALRAMGILKLLEGEKEEGLTDIRRAYDLNPEEAYVKETLIIALKECGQEEEAGRQLRQFEDDGALFDEEFSAYLSGAVSLYDYYVDPQQ